MFVGAHKVFKWLKCSLTGRFEIVVAGRLLNLRPMKFVRVMPLDGIPI